MEINEQSNIHLLSHPLLKHKITQLRKKSTSTNEFRQLVKEIAVIEGYEAFRDLPTKDVVIQTPLEETVQPVILPDSLCFVPILRAGLGMVDGLTDLIPGAHIGHIGMYRNEETHQPVEYFCKLPKDIDQLDVYLIDPMLATGGSAIDAVAALKKRGVKKIKFLCIIAAPEGVKTFTEKYPDVPLYIGALDRELNDDCYICPGLGDAGDRIYGTIQ